MKILVLPGDGIGPEVCQAALPVLKLLDISIDIEYGEIGWECWKKYGTPIPTETWDKIYNCQAVLLGATTSKGKKEAERELPEHLQGKHNYISPIIQLRKKLDLFANVRPCELMHGSFKPFRLTVIRENTEGLYAGIDHKGIPEDILRFINHPNLEKCGKENATFSLRLQTKFGLERLFNYAFKYAKENNYCKVTLADKPNVLRESGQFAADIFYQIASNYKEIKADIQNVDAVALRLVRAPEDYGVIVAENMFGDILSDLAAGIMGGLGFAPSANIGNKIPYFEPVHGSAPKYAGANKVNPSAMFLTISLLLDNFGYKKEALSIKNAVKQVIKEGKFLTYDIGGNATTEDMAKAILDKVANPNTNYKKQASIICVGNELLNGTTINSNATNFSYTLSSCGYRVVAHRVVLDKQPDIIKALRQELQQADLIIVNGGLGPTMDDLTRDAIAKALDLPLLYDVEIEKLLEYKLKRIDLKIDNNTKKQAYFPQDAQIIPNNNGMAAGFKLWYNSKEIIVLPGPPRECLPMMEDLFINAKISNPKFLKWRLLGITEPQLSALVEDFFSKNDIEVEKGIFWRYPYVDLELEFTSNLDVVLAQELDKILSSYIVSKDGSSAGDILHAYYKQNSNIIFDIKKNVIGEALLKRFKDYLAQPSAGTTAKKTMNIVTNSNKTFSPPYEGSILLTCQVNNDEYTIKIPKNRPEIVDYAIEFVALCILKSLKVIK